MNALVRTLTGTAAMLLVACPTLATSSGYSIGLNFGADEWVTNSVASNAGTLAPAAVAGVDAVKQASWNNLIQASGTVSALTADNLGVAAATSASVSWTCPNTWASTGLGEENNGFPPNSPDYVLMIGYLDTGNATTTQVTISGLPAQLTSGYDVYVYMLGGTGVDRGGGYRITDSVGAQLKDYLIGDGMVNPTNFVRDLGFDHVDEGTYLVFRGLTAADIIVEATTEAPYGMTRAPINAIQLVAAPRDTVAPTVPASMFTAAGAHFVDLRWTAANDNSGAVYYYEIDRGGTVLGKATGTNFVDTSVAPGTQYAYRVRAVDDSYNASAYSTAVNVTTATEVEGTGYLKFEVWTGMADGTAVSLLTDWILAGSQPNFVSYTPAFDSRPVYPDDSHEQYGAIISGWLTPIEGGDYTFFIRSDDASQLWISSDATTNNLQLMAEETGCCQAFLEPDPNQGAAWHDNGSGMGQTTLTPITLQAGQRYAVRLLYKEGGGGDYGQVAWRKAGDTTPAGALTPIPSPYLSGLVDISGASVAIPTQPANVTAFEGTTATFSLVADFTSPYVTAPAYQWYRNGQLITAATTASYTTPELSLTADQGAKFTCSVSVPGASVTSAEATLTVAEDNTPPAITRVKATSVSTLVITFNEPIDPTSASVTGNYGISGGVAVTGASGSGNSVLLNTGALTVGNTYTLTVGGVADRFGNAVPAGTTFTFKVSVVTYADVILADGPVMFYRFEETSGQVTHNFGTAGSAADGLWMTGSGPDTSIPTDVSSGTGPRPGEFLGFASDNRSGLFTGGSAVGGGDLWVDAQQQLLNNLGAFSLEYWVKPKNRVSDPTSFGTRIGIVGQNDAIEYGFIDQNTIQIWTPNGGSLNTTYSFPDETWHHVATIADGATIKNYFDGVFINQVADSAGGNYGTSTYNVHVGGGGAFDATGNFFTGEIDEVAIFQKAIPAARIAAHYRAGREGGELPSVEPGTMTVTLTGGNVTINWDGDGTLQYTSQLGTPWTDLGPTKPYAAPASESTRFYRVRGD